MKIILSHDIDHLYWSEHYFNDLFLAGLIYRNSRGFLSGKIGISTFVKRLKCWGRMHRIPELLAFYQSRNLTANFFFGMRNELNLSYRYRAAQKFIHLIKEQGHKVGVHGIAYDDQELVKEEFERFHELDQRDRIGIRTHYLRMADSSLDLFAKQGYLFDSSIEAIQEPFKVDGLWEIPISIMDASLLANSQMELDLSLWKDETLKKLDAANEKNIPYFVINFHDLYFSKAYQTFKDWYIWLVDALIDQNYEFVSFESAVEELNAD